MRAYGELESILVVFQNPREGRRDSYDDWYTNIHIRDAMRLDGAIATQRFITADEQPVIGGAKVDPGYFAHTIYEWESAAKSVAGHSARAGTPLMEITADCSFTALRDFFFRPVFLSHGWTREAGFRRGESVMTALILPRAGDEQRFMRWFEAAHAPAVLGLAGFGSVGLFSLHEEQSLPEPLGFPLVAVYGVIDRTAAVRSWSDQSGSGSHADLASQAREVEIGCWKPRIARLRAEQVADPDAAGAAEEARARKAYADRFLTQQQLHELLTTI
ncbi:MAG TPA: hypothetical protein VFL92_06870 [Sphingomonas sp.]|nr:hypothetical protein [Sphingomonas sp.]